MVGGMITHAGAMGREVKRFNRERFATLERDLMG